MIALHCAIHTEAKSKSMFSDFAVLQIKNHWFPAWFPWHVLSILKINLNILSAIQRHPILTHFASHTEARVACISLIWRCPKSKITDCPNDFLTFCLHTVAQARSIFCHCAVLDPESLTASQKMSLQFTLHTEAQPSSFSTDFAVSSKSFPYVLLSVVRPNLNSFSAISRCPRPEIIDFEYDVLTFCSPSWSQVLMNFLRSRNVLEPKSSISELISLHLALYNETLPGLILNDSALS